MGALEDWVRDDLFQSIKRPFRDLPDLMRLSMQAFAERAQLTGAYLTVENVGALVLDRAGREITCDWVAHVLPPLTSVQRSEQAQAASVDDAVRKAEWRSAPDYGAGESKRRPIQPNCITAHWRGSRHFARRRQA